MAKLKSAIKIGMVALYILLFAAVIAKLFFERQFDAVQKYFSGGQKNQISELIIGFPESSVSLSPFANDVSSRARLLHMYESLLRVDKNSKIQPALAISYGSLDNLTWEFRLRPQVFFHNGKELAIDDVIFSLKKLASGPGSGIESMQKISDEILHIKTYSPDPLLPSKLAQFFIFPKDSRLEDLERHPVGTGPYVFEKMDGGNVELKHFEKYWRELPAAHKVTLKTIQSKSRKIAALKNKEVDILAYLPADIATDFYFDNFYLKRKPSLEVNFLMFNFDGIFAERQLRRAVKSALNTNELVRLAHGFAVPVTQFVANGIFGFDPSIKSEKDNSDLSPQQKINVSLDLPLGLKTFGEGVKGQLSSVGINVNVKLLSQEELSKKILNQTSEFFFFGWESELGDSADFLTAVVHSKEGQFGQFNGGGYRNKEVDNLIELSQKTLDSSERLEYLRSVMRKITNEDIVGVPLFSPEVLYAVSKNVKWTPRVDAYVLAQEVKM